MKPPAILNEAAHRPWAMPAGRWMYYQEWNRALFLHWKVPAGIVQPLLPAGLEADTLNGETWISLVPFTMEKIRPRNLPALSMISDFHEINLRAYVVRDGRAGVYFLSIEASRSLSVFLSRTLSGMPYEKASISRREEAGRVTWSSRNPAKGFHLDAVYRVADADYRKTEADRWLTERYCAYVSTRGRLYRFDIHHAEWGIKGVALEQLSFDYRIGALHLKDRAPDLVHFSEGVKVLAWPRTLL